MCQEILTRMIQLFAIRYNINIGFNIGLANILVTFISILQTIPSSVPTVVDKRL